MKHAFTQSNTNMRVQETHIRRYKQCRRCYCDVYVCLESTYGCKQPRMRRKLLRRRTLSNGNVSLEHAFTQQ
jgi:hypothetical protein